MPGKDVFPIKRKVIFQLAMLVCWRKKPVKLAMPCLFSCFFSQVRFNASDKEPAKCLSVQSFELQPAKELVGAESGGFLDFLDDFLGSCWLIFIWGFNGFGDCVFIFQGLKGPSWWCGLVMEKTRDASECAFQVNRSKKSQLQYVYIHICNMYYCSDVYIYMNIFTYIYIST